MSNETSKPPPGPRFTAPVRRGLARLAATLDDTTFDSRPAAEKKDYGKALAWLRHLASTVIPPKENPPPEGGKTLFEP